MPLLQLERLTFRFVEVGFVVLTATLMLGAFTATHWRWGDRDTVLSLLGWGVFAALLVGRHRRGWRGRRATRWLYIGAALLLLAYVGSRFVFEVLLSDPWPDADTANDALCCGPTLPIMKYLLLLLVIGVGPHVLSAHTQIRSAA